jgi:hypothetical protein
VQQCGRFEAGVGGADRAGLRVGVHHPGHGVVAGLARLAEDVRGDDLALVLADVGQQPQARGVADDPQAIGGAQPSVDGDAVLACRDADRLQAEPGGASQRCWPSSL